MIAHDNSHLGFARYFTNSYGAAAGRVAGIALAAVLLLAGCGVEGESDGPSARGGEGAEPSGPPVEVAVAANFSALLREIVAEFSAETGVPVRISVGATGQLHAQIRNGAPYHLFLAADQERPRRLEEAGFAVPGSRRTYAVGRLALLAPGFVPLPPEPLDVLDRPEVVVAFANPRTAPYGAAARVLLDATGRGALTGARGESVGQVLQFVASGAADVGLLALAQVIDRPQADWAPIDPSLYPELRQDVVLLRAGAEVPGARALLDHLVSPPVRDLVARRGYAAPAGPPSHPDSP